MPENRPFFITSKEINFYNSVNEEIIDSIVGQFVDIYKIDPERTNANVYGESDTKFYGTGFRVNCLLSFIAPEGADDGAGIDYRSNIEIYFLRKSLEDADFYPEIGNIVDWNGMYWEINFVSEPQHVAGHYDYKHEIKATAHKSRISSLNIEERPR